MINFKFKYSCN